MATGSWSGTSPRGLYRPGWEEDVGDQSSGAYVNFDTGLTNIHNKLWRDNVINAVSDYSLSTSETSANNTTNLESARDALTNGGTIFIPEGTYELDDLKMKNNIHYIGAGIDATILLHKGTGSFVQNADTSSTLEYASISNLTLKAHANTDYLIHLVRSMRNCFKNLRFNGDKSGSGKATQLEYILLERLVMVYIIMSFLILL